VKNNTMIDFLSMAVVAAIFLWCMSLATMAFASPAFAACNTQPGCPIGGGGGPTPAPGPIAAPFSSSPEISRSPMAIPA
jgi:hypothetical protein